MADSKPKAVLERVPLSKLRPKEINPRSDFGDLDAFAAEFDDNPVFPGEPWTPPIVYRDANVYRIVDGERRYRAMKKAGKVSLEEVLDSDDPIASRMKVSTLLESLPGYGKAKAAKIMNDLAISPSRRIQGLGARQREQLLQTLSK